MQHRYRPVIIWLLFLAIFAASSQTQSAPVPDPYPSSLQKPGSSVALVSEGQFTMQQGQRLLAELLFSTAGVDGDLTIRLLAEPGLTLTSHSQFQFKRSHIPSQLSLALEVQANSHGNHLLHIFVTETRAQQVLTRALAVVIEVE